MFKKLTTAEKRKLNKQKAEQEREERRHYLEMESLLNCRAGKLIKKGKMFIVVAVDEPYFPLVYKIIRQHEKRKHGWTAICEENFQLAINQWLEL